MPDNWIIRDKLCTREEALALLRKYQPRRRVCVYARVGLIIDGDEGKEFQSGAVVHVTMRDAANFITGALSETLEKRGGRIKFSVSEHTLIIG